MAIITTVDECLKRDLLTWIGYSPNPRERACFPLPRFRDDGMTLTPIDPATFPDTGNITALIAGGQFSEEVASQFGNIVVARLNSTPGDNEDYRDGSNSNRYVAKLNLSYKRGTSQIEFSSFSSHPLSKRLLQVVEIGSKFDPAEPPSGKAALADADTIYTENFLVMAHGKTSSNLYGPFSFKSAGDGQVSGVFGLAEFDYRVYKFSKELTSAVLSLRDRDGFTQMDFVETAKIDAAIEEGRYIEEYDWIPRQQLVDALNRAVSLSDDAKGFGKNQMRRIKREISSIADDTFGLKLDATRRAKIVDLAGEIEGFVSLPDEIQDLVFDSLSNERLADIVLAPQNLARFKNQLLEIPELRSEIDKERARLSSTLDDLNAEVAEAAAERARIEGEVAAARESLVELRQRAEAEKSEELRRLEAACEQKTAEKREIEARIAELEEGREALAAQVDELVSLLDDKVELSAEMLKSEVIQRAVSFASGIGATDAARSADAAKTFSISAPADSAQELIDRLFDVVSEQSGRSYTRNDIINYYTCLTQGYITTFAGLPGTGKTSLCRLLAKGLGIDGPADGRFVEVSVERGWTSYRDFVGYYNPLTRTEERSNPEVFSALEQLTREDGADPAHVAPSILLLDEANLSPIEHYWAPFLKACDSFAEVTTKLPIGGERSLLVPHNARFLATVNYDHTTEELSPRFLDRSWVIMLNPDELIDDDDEPDRAIAPASGMVSYAELLHTFGRRPGAKIDPALEEILTRTLRICSACRHPVSPRSQQMMRGFVATASELMDTRSVETRFYPVDLAIAQKVLPQVSGPREMYEEMLDELEEACSQLRVTSRLIRNIRNAGENSGYYQFFA